MVDPRPQRPPLGDRIERAIAERAEDEGRLEQQAERLRREEREATEPQRRSRRRTLIWLAITGVSLYLVGPSLVEVLSSSSDLDSIEPWWFAAMVLLQTLAMASLWFVQRLALNRPPWPAVIWSQLAGNALSKIAPAGGAVGGALQYRMLVESNIPRGLAASSVAAVNLLTFAVVLVLPLLAIPALLTGRIEDALIEATVIGFGLFILLLALGISLLAFDDPLRWVAEKIQAVRNRLRRRSTPARDLPKRLVRERDRLLAALGPRWRAALGGIVARWAFDFLTLLAALAAVGATPSPGLVLLAFCAAQVLAQLPFTPGGVGFVEAGLTAMLALIGVGAAAAVLATLAYRLVSYWLPVPVGLAAYAAHRKRVTAAATG